jgi:hypothetical protein
VLEVVLPEAYVLGSVLMDVGTIAVGLVVAPFTLVDIPIGMDELSFSLCLVLYPVPRVLCTIWPCLDTVSVPLAIDPLTFIYRPSFKFMAALPLSFYASLLRLLIFFKSKVFTRANLFTFHKINLFPCLLTSGPRLQFND